MVNQKPDICVGTTLSIGEVVSIRNDGITVKNNGNTFIASFEAAERIFDDQNAQTAGK